MGVAEFFRNEWEKIWKIIRVYGSYSVDRELVDQMIHLVPSGTLLELGSGRATSVSPKSNTFFPLGEVRSGLTNMRGPYIFHQIKKGGLNGEDLEKKLPCSCVFS